MEMQMRIKKPLTTRSRENRRRRDQQGIVLVTGLIFLLILTLVGLLGTENSVFELNMAANVEDEKVAFYGASAGLDSVLFLEQDAAVSSTNKPLQTHQGLNTGYDPYGLLAADVASPLESLGVAASVAVSAELKGLNASCPRTEATTSSVFCDKYSVQAKFDDPNIGTSEQYQGYLKQVIDLQN